MRSYFNAYLLAALVALVVLAACDRLVGKESDLSYAEASNRIVELAERSLRIGLGDDLAVAEQSETEGLCQTAFNGPSDYVYPVVDYRFPIELLGDDPDSFVYEVEELWLANDLEITPSDSSRVIKRLGITSDGFNFEVYVNRESGLASVGGSGPCVDPPE